MINNVTLSPPPITPPSLSVSLCTCSPCAGEGEGAAGQLRLIGRQPLHQSQGQHRVGVRRWLRVQLGVRARGAAQPKEAPRRGQLKNPPPVCEGPCAPLNPPLHPLTLTLRSWWSNLEYVFLLFLKKTTTVTNGNRMITEHTFLISL